ncbi:MAG: HU family DNA-binding protein, partial [Gemmobacter sp.]
MADEAEPKADEAKAEVHTVARKELAMRIQKATGAKMKDVQLIMRATLAAMSDALKAGEHLRLPPFGAARVLRPADPENGQTMRVALREVKEKEKDKSKAVAKSAARDAAVVVGGPAAAP